MIAVATLSPVSMGAWRALESQPGDALLALIGMHRRDPRADKIDLGVGVYRDADGRTPVMAAIKAAEARLLETQDTKSYLGAEGDAGFCALLEPIIFGGDDASRGIRTGVQTPGGTGALRLGAELLARALPDAKVWIGTPSWPNHAPIFRESGLAVMPHRHFDPGTGTLDFSGMLDALAGLRRGDVLLLHGCCHNPSGADLSPDQWHAVARLLQERGAIPFIDLAYQGLGDGLEEDAAGMRVVLDAVPDALVAYSCDKNFGLYRDRVGALWLQAASDEAAERSRQNMLVLARSLWSMPPDHGAAAVRLVLEDEALTALWRQELDAMRGRINGLRRLLAAAHPRLAPIGVQRGMFAILPIDVTAVASLRETHGIYMADSGRINIAGLQEEMIPRLAAALRPYLGE